MSENMRNRAVDNFKFIHKTENEFNASYDILFEDRQITNVDDVSADKLDYQIAAFSGTLTAAFDIFGRRFFSLCSHGDVKG